jgi:hypothetical protein
MEKFKPNENEKETQVKSKVKSKVESKFITSFDIEGIDHKELVLVGRTVN